MRHCSELRELLLSKQGAPSEEGARMLQREREGEPGEAGGWPAAPQLSPSGALPSPRGALMRLACLQGSSAEEACGPHSPPGLHRREGSPGALGSQMGRLPLGAPAAPPPTSEPLPRAPRPSALWPLPPSPSDAPGSTFSAEAAPVPLLLSMCL